MEINDVKNRLMSIVSLSAEYCASLENVAGEERDDVLSMLVDILPRLYWEFANFDIVEPMDQELVQMPEYMDEDYYDSVRRSLEGVFGEDDMFLETFEEDMKYSDTPIAVSIAESLADIFQPLYNFVSFVRDNDGDGMTEAYVECRQNFKAYWGQTLCNVLRAVNHLKFNR